MLDSSTGRRQVSPDSGCSAAWLARLLREQEVGSSNLLTPTHEDRSIRPTGASAFFFRQLEPAGRLERPTSFARHAAPNSSGDCELLSIRSKAAPRQQPAEEADDRASGRRWDRSTHPCWPARGSGYTRFCRVPDPATHAIMAPVPKPASPNSCRSR